MPEKCCRLCFARTHLSKLQREQREADSRETRTMASSDDGVEIESEDELEVAATEEVGARQLSADSGLGEFKVEEEEAEEAGEEVEEIEPSTLGVPGLRTLSCGDRIDVLWSNGAL